MKKHVKKWLPNSRQLYSYVERYSWLSRCIHAKCLNYGHRAVARGVAAGLFAALIPLPLQMLIAVLLAAPLRGNILVAMVMTWISNPFTLLPITYIVFSVGHWITGNTEVFSDIPEFHVDLFDYKSMLSDALSWLQHAGKSFLIGLPVTAFLFALAGYLLVEIAWRLNIYYQLRKRNGKKRLKK